MRPGLQVGAAARVDTVVTADMVATLGGVPIHPVLATARMIEWMEWAGRRLIVPYLEPDEDAVGYAISIRHLQPTPVGVSFWAIARFRSQDGARLIVDVEASSPDGLVGQGEFVQVLVPKDHLTRISAEVRPPSPPTAHQESDTLP